MWGVECEMWEVWRCGVWSVRCGTCRDVGVWSVRYGGVGCGDVESVGM